MTTHDGRYDIDDEVYRGTAGSGGPPRDIGGPQPTIAVQARSDVRG